MTATGHAVIGTVIAAKIPDPFIAIPLAILSHIVADAFPHWDTGTNMRKKPFSVFFAQSFLDLTISYIVPFVLAVTLFPQTNLVYLYVIVFSAQLFDWITVPYVFFKWKFFPFTWPHDFQLWFDNRLDKPWGIIWQVAILAVLVVVAKVS